MRLKGINPFEQHVEKIVLGILSVTALGVVASQFLFEPNKVNIGQGEPLPPDRAYKPVEEAANELQARVRSGSPSLPEAPKVDILERFEHRLKGAVAPRSEIVAMGPRITFGGDHAVPGDSSGAVAAVAVPAPSIPTARSFAGSIDPLEVAQAPELAAILPKEQPFDKFAVSVEATFDGTALRSALGADPDGEAGPQRPIPIGWWRDAVEVVGIELQREKQLPGGEWGEPAVVAGMPARLDLLGQVQKNVKSSGDMGAVLEQARQQSSDILTPEYYSMIAGTPWAPPTEAQVAAGGPSARIDQLQKRLNGLDEDIERIQKNLAKKDSNTQGRTENAPQVRGQTARQSETDRERQAANRLRQGGEGEQQDGNKKAAPKTALEKKQDERERLAAEIELLREKMEKPAAATTTPDTDKPLLENPSVRLWAHDVTAEPGAVYRYRTRVVINNPLFGRETSLQAEQKEAATVALARGEWSEWTDPVQVDNTKYYFIMSAQERDAIGNNRATADLMEFFYGFYRKASVQLEPGDPIVADVKLPPDLREFDIVKLAAGQRPQDARPEEAPEQDHGGGRRAVKGQHEIAADPKPADAVADAVAVPLKRKLEAIDTGALLLDVAPTLSAAGGGKSGQPRVFVRDPNGAIAIRMPEPQGPDSLYQRLLASAKAGESQGRPKVEPRQPKTDVPGRPPMEQRGNRPKRDDEGGGGGGGG